MKSNLENIRHFEELKDFKDLKSLILHTKQQNLKSLSFYNVLEEIEEIPQELYQLDWLEKLNLGRFKLLEIPFGFQKLSNLKELTMDSSNFTGFPIELLSLKSLTNLSIKTNHLPKELNDWTTLKYLNLGMSRELKSISGIPPNLNYLYINGFTLKEIPHKIYTLEKISKLVLTEFNFSEIPIKLFRLRTLISLFLNNNKISKIPIEILKLDKLEELWLSNNLIKRFPSVITKMISLEAISLDKNFIMTIPEDIKKLENLKTLSLQNNKFKIIPDVIFNLKALTDLSFGNYFGDYNKNKIKIIPLRFLELENIKRLDLFLNTIENVPSEIISDGVDSIKSFLNSIIEAENEEFLYEAKMVVVGRGDVGKTVLTKKLSSKNYSLTKSESTSGIAILKNPFEFKMSGLRDSNNFRFNIWDFGGQEKYDATHQLFITRRSIYLFLTEARDESNYQDVFYWLNAISLFSLNSPVIIVLSKYDERKKLLPESIYKEKFKNIVEFVDVSCADGFEYTIENLKNAIKNAITLLPQTKLKLSNHWIDIRKELEELSNIEDYIDYQRYLDICHNNKLNQIKADFLSEYLNDLGVIIHHQQDLLLKKTVFLNTDWCVDGMYKVLDDEIVFKQKGKFNNNDLQKIWNEERFEGKQPELIKLMQNYSLCFKLADDSGYIAPDLLPLEKPSVIKWNYKSTLQIEYRYEFMPAGMISRFIVKSHNIIKKNYYWKYGVVLYFDNTEAIIEEDYLNFKIKISLSGENKKGLLSAIKLYIEDVHRDFDKGNKLIFQEMVPCNCSYLSK